MLCVCACVYIICTHTHTHANALTGDFGSIETHIFASTVADFPDPFLPGRSRVADSWR
jgi:hypothetical protein